MGVLRDKLDELAGQLEADVGELRAEIDALAAEVESIGPDVAAEVAPLSPQISEAQSSAEGRLEAMRAELADLASAEGA